MIYCEVDKCSERKIKDIKTFCYSIVSIKSVLVCAFKRSIDDYTYCSNGIKDCSFDALRFVALFNYCEDIFIDKSMV